VQRRPQWAAPNRKEKIMSSRWLASVLAALALAVGMQGAPISGAQAASPKPVKNYSNYVPGKRCLKMLGRDGNYEVCGNDRGGKTVKKIPSRI
jgi:hypothetical protein